MLSIFWGSRRIEAPSDVEPVRLHTPVHRNRHSPYSSALGMSIDTLQKLENDRKQSRRSSSGARGRNPRPLKTTKDGASFYNRVGVVKRHLERPKDFGFSFVEDFGVALFCSWRPKARF